MHPTVLLFVLLFIPNSSLRDWQTADAPILHQLMVHGAVGLMNARTAEHDTISPEAGVRSIFAGARMSTTTATDSTGYSANAANLLNGLVDAGVSISGISPAPEPLFPLFMPVPTKHFITANLKGSWEQIDGEIADYTALVHAKHGMLMIVSPNPSQEDYALGRQLTPVLLWGPGIPNGYLRSLTTRTNGLVTNTDIAPTVAAFMGVQLPSRPFGTLVNVGPAPADKIGTLLDRESGWIAQANALKVLPYLAAVLALLIVLAIYYKPQKIGYSFGIVSAILMVPFVLLLSGNLPIFAGLLILALAVALRGLMPDDAAPLTALAIILIVTVDSFGFGGRITGGSMLGYSPIEGARYYGIGNEILGAYIGALVVITGLWDWKGEHKTPLTILWIIAGISLALPTGGAKAGGLIVCATSLATYMMVGAGKKVTDIRTLAAIAASVVVAIGLLVVLSHLGPSTHIANALAIASTGGVQAVVQIIQRKASMDIHLVFHSVWIWVLILSSYGRWLLRRKDVLASVGTVATISCLIFNDAGVLAAAICGLIVWAAEFNRAYTPVAQINSSASTPAQV